MHPLYKYAYISDREEGLILVDVSTLTDGNPSNNFLTRAVTFNPDGALRGAETVTIAGQYAYVGCDAGMVVVDLDDVIPRVSEGSVRVGDASPGPHRSFATLRMTTPRSIAIQFRYAFVADGNGLDVVDITDPTKPAEVASVPIQDARSVYVARTYAYVAA